MLGTCNFSCLDKNINGGSNSFFIHPSGPSWALPAGLPRSRSVPGSLPSFFRTTQVFRVAFPDHFLLNMPPSPGRLPSPHPALLFIFCISRYNKSGHFPLAWFCLLTSVSSSERGKGESHCGRKATEPKGGKRKGKAPG